MATIIKSVRLQAGERFTLPPNSELIGTDNLSSLTSTCDLPTTVEDLQCYVALFATPSEAQVGSDTIYWGPNNARIAGYKLGNASDVSFGSDYRNLGPNIEFTNSVMTVMGNELKNDIPAIVSTASSFILSNGNDNGTLSYFLINTLPSIGENLMMVYTSQVPSNSDNFSVKDYIPFVPYADIVSGGYSNYPTCPVSS